MAETITALATLVAAVGAVLAVIVGYLNRRAMTAARDKADEAKKAAAEAKEAAERTDAKLVLVEGQIRQVGIQIDGRLTELLKSETGRAHSEGYSEGEQAQRDRSGPPV